LQFPINVEVISNKLLLQSFPFILKVDQFKQAAVIGFHSHLFWHLMPISVTSLPEVRSTSLIRPLRVKSSCFPWINISVLILFFIGKVIIGFSLISTRSQHCTRYHPKINLFSRFLVGADSCGWNVNFWPTHKQRTIMVCNTGSILLPSRYFSSFGNCFGLKNVYVF